MTAGQGGGEPPTPQPEHLRMIQDVITRLAGNSSSAKTWAVTVVAALFALAAADRDRGFALAAIYVLVAFGILDAYYLALERSYRKLYEDVVAGRQRAWHMRAGRVGLRDVVSAARSLSVYLLYGLSVVVALGILATA